MRCETINLAASSIRTCLDELVKAIAVRATAAFGPT
jgi:hypothetical protein